MTVPILIATNECNGAAGVVTKRAALIFDVVFTISALVIGILGLTKVLKLPVSSYYFLGASGLCVAAWAAWLITVVVNEKRKEI